MKSCILEALKMEAYKVNSQICLECFDDMLIIRVISLD